MAAVIAGFHFYWPGCFDAVGEFAPLDAVHRQFVYLGTSAIGLLLAFVAALTFYSAATVRSAPRGAVFLGFAVGALFTARAVLDLIFPVRIPLFGLEEPTYAIVASLGALGLATLVTVAVTRRRALGFF